MGRPRRRAGILAVSGIACVVLVLSSHVAGAASGRVILLQSHTAGASARRCLTLIHDELTAGGFDVASVDAGPDTDPVSMAAVMRRQQGAVATIALLGNPEVGPAELWILDQIGGAAEVRRIPAPTDDPERAAEVLAIRTIEVLRASALKWLVESSRQIAPATPVIVPSAPRSPSATSTGIVGFEAGLSLLYSVAGLGPAALPLARLRVAIAEPVFLRLTLAGLGTRPRVDSPLGSAVVSQDLGLLELGAAFRAGHRLRPLVTLGAGAFHASIEGQGVPPYVGSRDDSWAALLDGGAGIYLGGRVAIAVELHVCLAAPHSFVRFGEMTSETLGRPSVWATVTLLAWL